MIKVSIVFLTSLVLIACGNSSDSRTNTTSGGEDSNKTVDNGSPSQSILNPVLPAVIDPQSPLAICFWNEFIKQAPVEVGVPFKVAGPFSDSVNTPPLEGMKEIWILTERPLNPTVRTRYRVGLFTTDEDGWKTVEDGSGRTYANVLFVQPMVVDDRSKAAFQFDLSPCRENFSRTP